MTQLAIALPQRYDWPSSQQQEYNPRFSASVPAAVPAPCTCPIPAPAAAQVTGHSKGCSKDQHQWVLFFCFALWKDSVLQPVLSWSALKTATGETRGGGHKGDKDAPEVGTFKGQIPLKYSINDATKNRFKHILVHASYKYHPHAAAVQTEQEAQCAGHCVSTLCL